MGLDPIGGMLSLAGGASPAGALFDSVLGGITSGAEDVAAAIGQGMVSAGIFVMMPLMQQTVGELLSEATSEE